MEKPLQASTTKNDRLLWVEILRILACIAVITIHVTSLPYENAEMSDFLWKVCNFLKSFTEFGVPVFLMFSGMFMLRKDIPINVIFKKYIKKIVIAFLFWSFAYTALEAYSNLRSYGSFPIEHAIGYFINGMAHFWYIYALIALYLITPMLRKIAVDKKLTAYLLILSFVFSFAFPQMISLLEYCNVWQNFFLADELSWVLNKFNVLSVLQLVFYYLLGYFVSTVEIKGISEYAIYFAGLFSLAAKIVLSIVISAQSGSKFMLLFGRNTVTTAFFALAIYVFGKNAISKIDFPKKVQKVILSISTSTFSIYLMHIFVMICLDAILGLNPYRFTPVISVLLTVAVTFIISYVATQILQKIPILNKYIV